ncbi:hypothetical protein EJD97_007828, partial [Solanum chilense]
MKLFKKSKRNSNERIYCRTCRNPVARVQDYIRRVRRGTIIIRRVYNVYVPGDMDHLYGFIMADTYCGRCGTLIGWKFIVVPLGSVAARAGRFLLMSRRVAFWDGVPLLRLNANEGVGANEQNANQGLGVNEQNANQDLGVNEQDVGANAAVQDGGGNEQNDDQDVGANAAVQDGGGNEQNDDQDMGANAAVQDGGGNEQNDDQDMGANAAVQDGGGNEQNDDQDVGA